MEIPLHCRRAAHELFAEQASDLSAPGALVRAAVAISMHEIPDATPEAVEAEIDELAQRVKARVNSDHDRAYLAHLHNLLFDEEGFRGDEEDCYDPRNSYLPSVLERRRGLPITLVLIYKEVGERVGLKIDGVNAPGHFLAGVETDGQRMLVDPFGGGRLLTRDEAFQRIEKISGRRLPRSDDLLRAATPRQWLARMLQNLLHLFSSSDRDADVAAMLELRELL